nr:hypothetical protein [Georgfuchsia toluolica]
MTSGIAGFETHHAFGDPFHRSAVLLDDAIEILALTFSGKLFKAFWQSH